MVGARIKDVRFAVCVAIGVAAAALSADARAQDARIPEIYGWLRADPVVDCAVAPATESGKCVDRSGSTNSTAVPRLEPGSESYLWLRSLAVRQCDRIPAAERRKFGCAAHHPKTSADDASSKQVRAKQVPAEDDSLIADLKRLNAKLQLKVQTRRAAIGVLNAFAAEATQLAPIAAAPRPSGVVRPMRAVRSTTIGGGAKRGAVAADALLLDLGAGASDVDRLVFHQEHGLGLVPAKDLAALD